MNETLSKNINLDIKQTWVKEQLKELSEILANGISVKNCLSILNNFKDTNFNKKNNKPENSAQAIIAIQAGLKYLGYNPGKIDGIYKDRTNNNLNLSNTQKAIKKFREKNSLDNSSQFNNILNSDVIEKIIEKLKDIPEKTTIQQQISIKEKPLSKLEKFKNMTENERQNFLIQHKFNNLEEAKPFLDIGFKSNNQTTIFYSFFTIMYLKVSSNEVINLLKKHNIKKINIPLDIYSLNTCNIYNKETGEKLSSSDFYNLLEKKL